jgi:hypothetical protein
MTLRRRVFPVLRFGRLVDLDQQLAVDFRCRTLCRHLSRGFAFIGSQAIMTQFSFRSMTLRRRVFPVLLFIGAILLLHFLNSISSQQMF